MVKNSLVVCHLAVVAEPESGLVLNVLFFKWSSFRIWGSPSLYTSIKFGINLSGKSKSPLHNHLVYLSSLDDLPVEGKHLLAQCSCHNWVNIKKFRM